MDELHGQDEHIDKALKSLYDIETDDDEESEEDY